MAWITGCHHVLSVKHLLGQLRHSERTVLLAATGCQWSEAGHEEMQTWERNHVDGQFTQISVELQQQQLRLKILQLLLQLQLRLLLCNVSGAKPGIKKCRRGNGTMLTASLRRSAFSYDNNNNNDYNNYNNYDYCRSAFNYRTRTRVQFSFRQLGTTAKQNRSEATRFPTCIAA